VFLGVADEVPARDETPVVAIAELVEKDAPHFADARRKLQHFDEILRVEPTRPRLQWQNEPTGFP
jgi:hypothetical protein